MLIAVGDQFFLEKLDAVAMIYAVRKYSCYRIMEDNHEQIKCLKDCFRRLCLSPMEVVITVLNPNDIADGLFIDALLEYNQKKVHNEYKVFCGFADRAKIKKKIESFDKEAAFKLENRAEGISVVVVYKKVAEIFTV